MKDVKKFNTISDCLMTIRKQLEMIIYTSDTPDMLQDAQFMMVSCDELGELNVKYLKKGEMYKEPEPVIDKGMREEYRKMLESMSQVERDRLLMGNFTPDERLRFLQGEWLPEPIIDAPTINDLNDMGLTNIPGAGEGPEPGTQAYDDYQEAIAIQAENLKDTIDADILADVVAMADEDTLNPVDLEQPETDYQPDVILPPTGEVIE